MNDDAWRIFGVAVDDSRVFRVLACLQHARQPLKGTEIAEQTGIAAQHVSSALRILEERGWIQRTRYGATLRIDEDLIRKHYAIRVKRALDAIDECHQLLEAQ